jgi:hypothetical protein
MGVAAFGRLRPYHVIEAVMLSYQGRTPLKRSL